MLSWAFPFNIFCFLDNHNYQFSHHQYECLLAAGSKAELEHAANHNFERLQEFSTQQKDWIFGHLAYDLKNEIENLESSHPDGIGFPDCYFFVPEILIQLSQSEISIGCLDEKHAAIFQSITSVTVAPLQPFELPDIKKRISRSEYISIIEALRRHILRGDCYEINFCQEFFAEHVNIPVLQVYQALSELSPNPFSALYKLKNRFLLCASPERFLKKEGGMLYSQPIKGTRARDRANTERDETNRQALLHSEKDRSENVMVVDLVRNDLSRVCREGTVKVEELFGVYAFPQVHQMISTISGEIRADKNFSDALRACFPMGSMTGAPKRNVMQLIERYEKTRRGLFSGALGYIRHDQDFDFNVVIRSILYNSETGFLSYQAGSGITFYSDAQAEYEECLLKAEAIRKVLNR